MKKIIYIMSIFTLSTNIFLNSNIIEDTKKIVNLSDSGWSGLHLQNFDIPDSYDAINPENNDININYQDFKDLKPDLMQYSIFNYIGTAIDTKYDSQEQKQLGTKLMISNMTDSINSYTDVYMSVIDESTNSNQTIEDNTNIFTKFTIETNEIQSYNLRISNNSSNDWSSNISYFDVSLNICNFDTNTSGVPVWENDLNNYGIGNGQIKDINTNSRGGTAGDNFYLPYKDISPEITDASQLDFFTGEKTIDTEGNVTSNKNFSISSSDTLYTDTNDHGSLTGEGNSAMLNRDIDLDYRPTGVTPNDFAKYYNYIPSAPVGNVPPSSKLMYSYFYQILKNETSLKNTRMVTNNISQKWAWGNRMHAAAYSDMFMSDPMETGVPSNSPQSNESLQLRINVVSDTIKGSADGNYTFGQKYGDVKIEVYFNNLIFQNLAD